MNDRLSKMSKVIVQPLIEALSELVAQIAQIIVTNKAVNKAPPKELPMCVAAVQKSAGTLVQVAKQLAQDEYDDFPVIQDEIVIGASDVENAARQLNEATVTLATGPESDRSGAWESLGDAVRVMAQETSILLHIVYGAEIKKIFALSNHTGGKLQDLLTAVLGDVHETNPQLFVNKVQAAMEDAQKLAQGLEQKAQEEAADPYASKELEEAARAISVLVEPFVAHANELLAKPKDAKAKEAVKKDLKDLMSAAERVGAPKPKNNVQSFVPELMECISKMEQVDPATPAGQKEAQRMLSHLDGITRANRIVDMGPATSLMNHLVDVSKDLDGLESMLLNPGVKPLGDVDPLKCTEPDAQAVLNYFKKLAPDDNGGRDSAMADAEKLVAIVHNDLLPAAQRALTLEEGAARAAALQAPLAAIKAARAAVGDVKAGMDLSAEQAAQIGAAEKTNALCIKLGAMVGSKKSSKQDIFSAAKGLTDMLSEMSALLGLAQEHGNAHEEGARGALLATMSISEAGQSSTHPTPVPKPGSAKAALKKLAGPAASYKTPAQKNLVSPDRGSVSMGFASLGVEAEELKTLSVPKATKGAELMPDSDAAITGVRALGEQLALLAQAATSGNNDALLKSGRAIHEQMKAYSNMLRQRAAKCKDPKAAHELITLSNQLQNWSVQLKILTSVKASSGGGRDSDKALISMTKQIQAGLRGAPAAVLKGLLSS